ncbi:MAG TPA: DNA-deoxyinosine glycosylase [Planctomycetes bacterium]|nr:DNA-deoxyinosine glycosylase [Planctomycetota bacterium]
MHVHSFDPIADHRAHVLILGSMPGKASLAAHQYYAHPRNLFWPLVGEILGFDPTASYHERTRCLLRAGVALWDVLETCTRTSSLDSDIVESSIEVNDLPAFLADHSKIERIVFNGAKAEHSFLRYVLPKLEESERYALLRVPSTSPANASIPRAKKLAAWRAALTWDARTRPNRARPGARPPR